jgi:FMN-dependent NADH-azoreductase
MKLLHLDSSILGDHSVSRQLTREVVDAIRLAEPAVDLSYRDLTTGLGLQVDGALLAARGLPPGQRSPAQQALVAQADAVMAEFLAAELLVIGAPMYNFSIPSQLKTWIDLISVAGVTFRYGPNGQEGLATGKRVVIVATAGGQYAGRPEGRAHVDYLRQLLTFLGISDIRVVTAEGLAMGPAVRDPALVAARARIAEVGMA